MECVDPITLGCKIVEECDCTCNCGDCDTASLPEFVCGCFEGDLVTNGQKLAFVTIGLFSIVRLERKVQLLIPCYDFCIPDKECIGSTDDNPCKLFRNMKFPTDEFFPPQIFEFPGLNPVGPGPGGCGCR